MHALASLSDCMQPCFTKWQECSAHCRYFALCFCLPTWWERALFFAISHAGFGIINLQVWDPCDNLT